MDLVGRATRRDEAEIFAELAALCVSPGYAHAIALFCVRDNMLGIRDAVKGEHMAHLFSRERLVRTEISTLIGLMVKGPLDLTIPEPALLQDYLDRSETLLQELHRGMSGTWFEGLDAKILEDSNFNPFAQGQNLREPIFYGGESAYSFQYRDLVLAKYGQDDAWLKQHRGFCISTARAVVKASTTLQGRKVFEQLRSLKDRPQAEWTLLPGFEFTVKEISAEARISEAVVQPVIEAFALPAGDRNASFAALTDYNATNGSPLIRTEEGTYLLYQIYSLAEALYESPFYWLGADKAYAPTALKNRGMFTEQIAGEFLTRVFGKTHVFTNVILPAAKGATRGEIDVLVLFGDRAIVVQAKSKRLSLEARKGNDLVVKDDFKKAVQAAADQAILCAEALLKSDCKLLDADGREISLTTSIKEVFPVCVVADHYPALHFQAGQFLKVQPAERIAKPLTTDVFALDVMTEMLSSPLRFLSYLSLRARCADKLLATHELTILGYHLKRNLWIEDQYDLIMMEDDLSADLDAAMIVRREGFPGPRTPEGILTRLQDTAVMRLLAMIDDRPDPAIMDFALFVLEAGEDTIRSMSNAMDDIRAATRAYGRQHDATFAIGDGGVTLHSSRLPAAESATLLRNHCRRRKYAQRAEKWFGLALDPDTGDVRLGVTLDQPWKPDPAMDEIVKDMKVGKLFKGKWPRLKVRMPGRNEPCLCGSGLKYKKCCLKG